jgi:hypothetical protein
MFSNFQRPNDWYLTILSVLWILASVYFVVTFMAGGHVIVALLMGLFGLAAAGLWFQSRAAAWTLIAIFCFGIIGSLFRIGHMPMVRTLWHIALGVWSITLLAAYLKEEC